MYIRDCKNRTVVSLGGSSISDRLLYQTEQGKVKGSKITITIHELLSRVELVTRLMERLFSLFM